MKYIIIGVFVGLVIFFGPLALIWALNTLFNLAIAYTLKTWAAALIIGGIVGSSSAKSS